MTSPRDLFRRFGSSSETRRFLLLGARGDGGRRGVTAERRLS